MTDDNNKSLSKKIALYNYNLLSLNKNLEYHCNIFSGLKDNQANKIQSIIELKLAKILQGSIQSEFYILDQTSVHNNKVKYI